MVEKKKFEHKEKRLLRLGLRALITPRVTNDDGVLVREEPLPMYMHEVGRVMSKLEKDVDMTEPDIQILFQATLALKTTYANRKNRIDWDSLDRLHSAFLEHHMFRRR